MTTDFNVNPYETAIEAGLLRRAAAQKLSEADTMDGLARLQLQRDGVPSNPVVVQSPGTTLCIAFGGQCDGQMTRAPMDAMMKLKLVPNGVGTSGVIQMQEYEPAMIVRLGGYVGGALIVPKGRISDFFNALRAPSETTGQKPVALAMARLLINCAGYGSEMITDIYLGAERSATLQDEAPSTPLFVQLGEG